MEVKPCPFCGKKPDVEKGYPDINDANGRIEVPYRVICRECGIYMSCDAEFAATYDGKVVRMEDGYMKLISKWNRRAKE